eukprot:c48461_g1_i1.p1 GENE.c48461_g1_i1~~c48461_g1_i1.p1  ORF type:complete len:437 (+),score=46.00 c48461_g1_i1:69-1379(+)
MSETIYTAAQVAKHCTKSDFWLIVNDNVYDVTPFISSHPGGPVIETYGGLDATDVYAAMHPQYADGMLAGYRIGRLDRPNATAFQREYRALRASFVERGLFKSSKFFYARMIGISTAFLAIALFCFLTRSDPLFRAIGALALAIFWQQNGWISHDFLHYSVFATRFSNWVLPWIYGAVGAGYTYIWWSRKHNTHHAVPNTIDGDPDIDTMPVLAWSERNIARKGPLGAVARFWLRHQHIAFLPLLAFARLSWTVQSGLTVFEDGSDYPQWRRDHRAYTRWRFVEGFGQVLYWSWTLTLFFATMPFREALTWYLIAQAASGVLLALPFVLNHSGMDIYSEGTTGQRTFFELQACTGRNISPSVFMNWFTGGLNFQIEHHLYPRMPRHNTAIIAPEVEALCRKHGVRYHSVGFVAGVWEVVEYPRKVGASVDADVKGE